MNNTELAELLLAKLYELGEADGYTGTHSLTDIAAEFGVTEPGKVVNAAKILHDRGLILASFILSGPDAFARINSEGTLFVERGGQTGIIRRYQSDPAEFDISIDQSTHFHGSVSQSNIATHSAHVTQSTNLPEDLSNLLSQTISALHADKSLREAERNELISDVELLRTELARSHPRDSIVKAVISTLGSVASIGNFVIQLARYLPTVSP